MKCNNPQCQKEVRPEWKVCPFCQTPVAGKTGCVNCGEKLEPGWTVCPFCQTPVEKQAAPKKAGAPMGEFCQGCGTLLQGRAFKCDSCNGIFCLACRVNHPDGRVLPLCESCGFDMVAPIREKRKQEALEKQQAEAARKEAEARQRAKEEEQRAEEKRKRAEAARRRAEQKKKPQEAAKRSLGIIPDPQGRPIEWYVGPDSDITWDDAKRYAESVTADGGGWRLPTLKELKGLYKEGEGKYNMSSEFGTFSCPFIRVWSGEVKDSSSAWFFGFSLSRASWGNRAHSSHQRGFAVRSRG